MFCFGLVLRSLFVVLVLLLRLALVGVLFTCAWLVWVLSLIG